MTVTDAAPNLIDLDADETSAPPRANGELVFAEPWESRAFGMDVLAGDGTARGCRRAAPPR